MLVLDSYLHFSAALCVVSVLCTLLVPNSEPATGLPLHLPSHCHSFPRHFCFAIGDGTSFKFAIDRLEILTCMTGTDLGQPLWHH